jgi:ribonuclease HI
VSDEKRLYCDGATRNNGTPEQWSWVTVMDSANALVVHKEIGATTNNVAEYMAIEEALKYLEGKGQRGAVLVSDSQLCVNQIAGRWKIKAPHLQEHRDWCAAKLESLAATLVWGSREENRAGWYNEQHLGL